MCIQIRKQMDQSEDNFFITSLPPAGKRSQETPFSWVIFFNDSISCFCDLVAIFLPQKLLSTKIH